MKKRFRQESKLQIGVGFAMNKSDVTVWVVLGLSFVVANLPFLFVRLRLGRQLLALVGLYFLVGGFAALLEVSAYGTYYPQRWEFYATTVCLFLVFAFPGFVYCHLWRGNRRSRARAS